MAEIREVVVPDIGDFADVPVIEVLVSPGDSVAPEDPLVTLESDKATMDVPAPFGGTVAEIAVSVGDTVSEGSPILTLQVHANGEPAQAPPVDVWRPAIDAGLPAILDHAAVSWRHPARRARWELAAGSLRGFRAALDALGFTEIQTPKLVPSATESGATMAPAASSRVVSPRSQAFATAYT